MAFTKYPKMPFLPEQNLPMSLFGTTPLSTSQSLAPKNEPVKKEPLLKTWDSPGKVMTLAENQDGRRVIVQPRQQGKTALQKAAQELRDMGQTTVQVAVVSPRPVTLAAQDVIDHGTRLHDAVLTVGRGAGSPSKHESASDYLLREWEEAKERALAEELNVAHKRSLDEARLSIPEQYRSYLNGTWDNVPSAERQRQIEEAHRGK